MKTYFDCTACLVRQAVDVIKIHTDDPSRQHELAQAAFRELAELDFDQPPPVMAQRVNRAIRKLTGRADPYRELKKHFNRLAMRMLPTAREWIARSDEPLETALRLAIAGNIVDLGAKSNLDDADIEASIHAALSKWLVGDPAEFRRTVSAAGDILYVADNSGEIVFDRLLIEQIGPEKVTLAVRGAPVINDATRADAEMAGLTELVTVTDSGSDMPGTVLSECNRAFRERFEQADLIVSKGQGNYETLNDATADIFFLLQVKCPVVARDLECPVGSMVARQVYSEAQF